MKRNEYSFSIAHANNAGASSSFILWSKTVLTFMGNSPAALAACNPSMTSSKRSLYVSFLKRSRLKVSKLILIRFKPAFANGIANSFSFNPLVVRVKRGALARPAMRSTISTISGRSNGSPPVKRTSLIPCSTATSITVRSSLVVNKSSLGIHAAKSLGMQ